MGRQHKQEARRLHRADTPGQSGDKLGSRPWGRRPEVGAGLCSFTSQHAQRHVPQDTWHRNKTGPRAGLGHRPSKGQLNTRGCRPTGKSLLSVSFPSAPSPPGRRDPPHHQPQLQPGPAEPAQERQALFQATRKGVSTPCPQATDPTWRQRGDRVSIMEAAGGSRPNGPSHFGPWHF